MVLLLEGGNKAGAQQAQTGPQWVMTSNWIIDHGIDS